MHNNFLEIQFPSDISYGSSGGPEFHTEIITTTIGGEIRDSKLHIPRMYFNISTGIKNKYQMEKILTFFRICKGRQIGFRYKDWSDFKGNGKMEKIDENTFQLVKIYQLNDIIHKRIIQKPIQNTVKIYYNDQLLSDDQTHIDYTTGRITVIDSSIIKYNSKFIASFEFDIPVRFDIDHLPITVETNAFYSLPEIPVIEIIN